MRSVLGEIPILASEQRLLDEAGGDEDVKDEKEAETGRGEKPKSKPKILADGTYATESAYTSASTSRLEAIKAAAKPPLRSKQSYLVQQGQYTKDLSQRSSSKATSTLALTCDFYTGSAQGRK